MRPGYGQAVWFWGMLYGLTSMAADSVDAFFHGHGTLKTLVMCGFTAMLLRWCCNNQRQCSLGLTWPVDMHCKSFLHSLPLVIPPLIGFFAARTLLLSWSSAIYIIAAAMCEEIFFRGMLLASLTEKRLNATLWTSIVFALYHLINIPSGHFVYAFVLIFFAFSVSIAYCEYVTHLHSLIPCIVSHAIYNLLVASFSFHNPDILILYCAGSVSLICISLWIYHYKRADSKEEES